MKLSTTCLSLCLSLLGVVGCTHGEPIGLTVQRDVATAPGVLYVKGDATGMYVGLLLQIDGTTHAGSVAWFDDTSHLELTDGVPMLGWAELPCALDFGAIDPGLKPPTVGAYIKADGLFAPATLTSRNQDTQAWTGVAYGAHGPGGSGAFVDVPQCGPDLGALDASLGGYLLPPPAY